MSDELTAEFLIEQAAQSHAWMLETIQHKADETSGGNYSDELKHAILVGAMFTEYTK